MIEVLGAGAAVLSGTDHDPRGHNFNLICIEDNGLRYVRQVFAPPNQDFDELLDTGYPTQSFELSYQRAWKMGYRYRTIHWSLDIDVDVEGDRFNEIVYTGVAVDPKSDLKFIQPPSYVVETGHLSPVWLNTKKSWPQASLRKIRYAPRRVEFAIDFAKKPTEDAPAYFTLESYDYNACSLDAAEFRRKFPKRPILREWEEKSIEEPVDDFAWTVRFPPELKFARPPEFEVLDAKTLERHEWLTRVLAANFYYSQPLHTTFLAIHRPPAGYLYRVYWYVPPPPDGPAAGGIDPLHQLKVDAFRRKLLGITDAILAKRTPPSFHLEVRRVLQAFSLCVEQKIEQMESEGSLKRASLLSSHDLDVSLMVYDKDRHDVPLLRIVSCLGPEAGRYWPFTLEVGDGNAGRAFKKNIIRSWNANSADRHQTYIHANGISPHSILYSMPMRHPVSQDLIYGILNLGVHEGGPAGTTGLLRLLDNTEGFAWCSTQRKNMS